VLLYSPFVVDVCWRLACGCMMICWWSVRHAWVSTHHYRACDLSLTGCECHGCLVLFAHTRLADVPVVLM